MNRSPVYLPVSVTAAAEVARCCDKDVVVILAVDRPHDRTHVTTYGRTADDKALAAELGDTLGRALPQPQQVFQDFRSKDAAAILARCERAEAAAGDALAFVRHALEFFNWSAFPHVRGAVEQLRDKLAAVVPAAGEGGAS